MGRMVALRDPCTHHQGSGVGGCLLVRGVQLWAAQSAQGTLASHVLCLSLPLPTLAGHPERCPRTPSLPSLAQHLAAPPSLSPFDQPPGSAFFLLHLVSLTSSHLDQSWLPCTRVYVSVLHGGCESPAQVLSFLGSAQAPWTWSLVTSAFPKAY